MAFLITNDDGIDAPGIRALYDAVAQITDDRIAIVAPKHHQSGCGHQVNIRTSIPVEWRSDTEVSVDLSTGTKVLKPVQTLAAAGTSRRRYGAESRILSEINSWLYAHEP